MSQPRTLLEFLHAAREYLQINGVDNPRGDAEALLGKVLDVPRLQLYLQHDRLLKADEVARYRDVLARRGKREPLQLILGEVEFCGSTIQVSSGLLIPRPETEELALMAIEWAETRPAGVTRALDIGTGTGCIAVAIAVACRGINVDAVDVDLEALRATARNADRNGVAERIRVIRADLFAADFATSVSPPYSLVISNPPYVAEEDEHLLDPEVRDYEPRQALIASRAGLAFYERIAELLPSLLSADGIIAVEVGIGQADKVREILKPSVSDLRVVRDIRGIARMVTGGTRGSIL